MDIIKEKISHRKFSIVFFNLILYIFNGKISNASQNQKGVLEQITTNVDSISNVVQSNSSFAQNSAATSAELSDQSKRLHELVNRFHLKKNA